MSRGDAAAEWTRDAVAYQIFVDRFAVGDLSLPRANVVQWGSQPTSTSFMGGDLRGIADRLTYLEDLGVNMVCLTPIFMSSSNHRYNTYDYYRIDPSIGTIRDLRRLVREAHRRGIRIILDGVFNHCGRGFYPFFNIMENGACSRWKDWFYIDSFPVDAYGAHRYKAWQDSPSLPEFNLENREARDFLLGVAEFWTRQGIDGWRLDAVRHVRHREFWGELRRAVRNVNPTAYLLAEVWGDAGDWLDAGYFDGATNYRFREVALEFLVERSIRTSEFARRLAALVTRQSWVIILGMCNLIGSHDTPRIWTVAQGDLARVKLVLLLQFFFPGIPAIYYGDEIGLEGNKDPDNRRAMEWDASRWNLELRRFVRQLVTMRRSLRPLQFGDWQTVLADDRSGVCVFLRRYETESAMLVIHNGDQKESLSIDLRSLNLPESAHFQEQLGGKVFAAQGYILQLDELQPRTGALLMSLAQDQSIGNRGQNPL